MKILPLAAAALLLPSVAACNVKDPVKSRVWVLNAAESLKRTPDEEKAAAKTALEGLDIVLEMRTDNTFSLTIKGGPQAQVSTGTYKSGFDNIFLVRKTIDGKPAPADDDWKLVASSKHIEVPSGAVTAVLTEK